MTNPVAVVFGDTAMPFTAGSVAVGPVEVTIAVSALGTGTRIDWSVGNSGHAPVALDRIGIRFDGAPEQVLEHGYQSWSVVRRCGPDEARPERRDAPAWVRGLYLADPDRAGSVVAGDQFLVTDAGTIGFLDGRSHLSTVAVEAARPEANGAGLTAWALLDGVMLGPGEQRSLDPLWWTTSDAGAAYSELAGWWGAEMAARTASPAPVGWCSWYHYFADVTPADVRANLALAAERGFGLVQIDDGYQAGIGEWLATRPSWTEGTAALAREIHAAGPAAGIWTAPFLVAEDSQLLADHPDWVVRDHKDRPLRAMWNPGSWGGWAVALDTTHPAELAHLRDTFAALRAQGFEYHKIDFCYAAALPGRRFDATKTRGESLRAGLTAVRAGIGDEAFLLGCGCPLGQAVGLVDAMRVSGDVAPHWDPKLAVAGFEECVPSARNAIAASVLRAPLHRRLWINDPDCLLLRPTATELESWQRRMLAAAIAGVGAFAVVSDDLSLYGHAEWELLETLRSMLPEADAPLDIVDPFAATVKVRSHAYDLTIDWRDGASSQVSGGEEVVLEAAGPAGWARLARH